MQSGNWDIYVVETEGGMPKQLTVDSRTDAQPNWSRDGKTVYFWSDRTGRREIWRVPSTGGEPVQVTQSGGEFARESWNGDYLYFTKSNADPWLWRMPLRGGEETQVVRVNGTRNWDLNAEGIVFREVEARVRWRSVVFWFYDLGTGRRRELFSRKVYPGIGISVSSDGTRVLFTEDPVDNQDLILVENFG
jgi:Tol biopolymer transport system component